MRLHSSKNQINEPNIRFYTTKLKFQIMKKINIGKKIKWRTGYTFFYNRVMKNENLNYLNYFRCTKFSWKPTNDSEMMMLMIHDAPSSVLKTGPAGLTGWTANWRDGRSGSTVELDVQLNHSEPLRTGKTGEPTVFQTGRFNAHIFFF
jgi:hypothetical protein